MLTVQVLLLLQFLAPYVRYLFSAVYEVERRNQVTERVIASGVWSVDQMVRVSDNVCRMNDGNVGRAIGEAVVYWVEGVTGGIQQGVGEGLVEMRSRR
jgi:hypothetical protein